MRPKTNFSTLLDEGKYLAALVAVENELRSAPVERANYLGQMKAQYAAFCGDDLGALTAWDAAFNKPSGRISPPEPLPGARLLDAHEEILKQAAKHQVIIINEAHHVPRHRAFAASLLPGLRRLGFTYFAAETFDEPKVLQASLARHAITQKTGYYAREAVFAAYAQTALDLAYTPVAYEAENLPEGGSPTDRINARETAQATNLYERIFRNNPHAKVVIHVGVSHATRTPDVFEEDGKKVELIWMAGRLTKLLGFPLLTIDQTGGTEASAPAYESARLRGILDRPDLERPAAVQMPDKSLMKNGIGEDCDLTIFHPRMKLRNGRPDWLFPIPGRKKVALPAFIVTPKAGRLLVQAFAENAPGDAIDIDRFLLAPNIPRPVLLLPRGRYRLATQDEEGNITNAGKLTV